MRAMPIQSIRPMAMNRKNIPAHLAVEIKDKAPAAPPLERFEIRLEQDNNHQEGERVQEINDAHHHIVHPAAHDSPRSCRRSCQ